MVTKSSLSHPISILENVPSKESFKKLCKAKIISYWENKVRGESALLPSWQYFHLQLMHLTKPHPIWTTAGSNPYEVTKAIQQARFLSGRYRSAKLMRHWASNNKDGFCQKYREYFGALQGLHRMQSVTLLSLVINQKQCRL